jgi:hypothetical protein
MAVHSAQIWAHVTTPAGDVVAIPEGGRLVFGRGPDADLIIAAGRGLSRRAGLISAVAGGAWVANLSRTHALYAEGDGYRVRLPRVEDGTEAGRAEPSKGWFLRDGTALVGSRAMLDEGQPLRLLVAAPRAAENPAAENPAAKSTAASRTGRSSPAGGDVTLLPFYLDPNTKLFLVALLWCRPWLVDAAHATPLPRTPEIARAALAVTDAHHELDCFDTDPAFRDRLSARVGEHLKVLRRKLADRSMVRPGIRLSDEVVVGALIENGIVARTDLDLLTDPAWCSRQEDLWWS